MVEILGGSLQFAERAGRLEERLDVALLTLDERARAANGRSAALDLRLTPEQSEGVRHTGVRWLSHLDLPPGRYQVRVAASAARTGKTGLVTYDIDVPRFDAGRLSLGGVTLTSLTSVLMVTRSETPLSTRLPSPPSAARTFVAGDRITAAAEVYVPASVRGDVSVSAQVEGSRGSTPLPIARQLVTGRGQPHREELIFTIETASLATGSYVLRLVVNPSAGVSDRLERAVPFEITRQ